MPYYKNNEDKNVWIVKPASNARGHGIWVSNKLKDILPTNGQGNKGQDTVVMKYIENPLLFPVNQELFKFDIRQWVLVTSIDPLEIYVFNSFYGRLCSFPYKLDDFSNTGIHLSNFSLNKQFFQKQTNDKEETSNSQQVKMESQQSLKNSKIQPKEHPKKLGISMIVKQDNSASKKNNNLAKSTVQPNTVRGTRPKKTDIKEPIQNTKNISVINEEESAIEDIEIKKMVRERYNVDWDSKIKPQINKIIVKTIQSCNSKLVHRDRGFEIFGFDLMLDADLNPWLIEVNLSPACSERTQFLKNMLREMTEHLFRILRYKEKIQTDEFNQKVQEYKQELEDKARRQKLTEEREKLNEKNYVKGTSFTAQNNQNSVITSNLTSSMVLKQSSMLQHAAGSVLFTQNKSNKPVKLMNSFYDENAIYAENELDIEGKDLTYRWEAVLIEQKTQNSQNKTFSRGQRNFMEVVGKKCKISALKREDYVIKSHQ